MTQSFYVFEPAGGSAFSDTFAFGRLLKPERIGDCSEHGTCGLCGFGLGMRPWLPPIRLKLSQGVFPDILWGAGFDFMGSERFKKVYEESGLRGIARFDGPVTVALVGSNPIEGATLRPPTYYNVWYTYGAADLDDCKSHATRVSNVCPRCRQSIKSVRGVFLCEGSLTGEDIFEAFGLPGSILVSSRFKSAVEESRLTGASFIPAEEFVRHW